MIGLVVGVLAALVPFLSWRAWGLGGSFVLGGIRPGLAFVGFVELPLQLPEAMAPVDVWTLVFLRGLVVGAGALVVGVAGSGSRRDRSLGEAWGAVGASWWALAAWAVVDIAVGVFAIGALGSGIGGPEGALLYVGSSWSWIAVTFLVLPGIVLEDGGFGMALRRGLSQVRRRWKAVLVVAGGAGLGGAFVFRALAGVLVVALTPILEAGVVSAPVALLVTRVLLAVPLALYVGGWGSLQARLYEPARVGSGLASGPGPRGEDPAVAP